LKCKNDWDKILNVSTSGRDDSAADNYHHPYEPTPYEVLERLADSGYIRVKNILVDYGCGKGRVSFFLHHKIGCKTIGLEYDEKIYMQALDNLSQYGEDDKMIFCCENAAEYEVKDADCFYFFNPFSVEILHSVLAKILNSYYENPREMKLFFYYPDDEYIAYLMSQDEFLFVDEIDCQDLFKGKDARERIIIFEIEGYA
jgi:SAM-dependent methyltransferase